MHRYFEINEGGHNIRCKVYCTDPRQIKRMVIFCHGFGGHKDNGAAEKFAERMLTKYKGCAMITFNLPCHGDDVKKKLSLADCTAYFSLVLDHVRKTYPKDEIYCYATSFGGYLTLKYISEYGNPFRRIVLRCPAVNMAEVLVTSIMKSEDGELLAKGKDVPVGFDRKIPVSQTFINELREADILTRDFLELSEDILILHGTADEIVPFDVSAAFADENLIKFIPVEGADHRFRDQTKMEQAIKSILGFFGW
ncbi:MAG: alpha/beta hydrolase [Ruminococcaceae bacterium]|nr:alpha/beta hydrolase [Oscillospiraceae bacterium]